MIESLFIAIIFFPAPHPSFFPLFMSPPLMVIEILLIAILFDHFIEKWDN